MGRALHNTIAGFQSPSIICTIMLSRVVVRHGKLEPATTVYPYMKLIQLTFAAETLNVPGNFKLYLVLTYKTLTVSSA